MLELNQHEVSEVSGGVAILAAAALIGGAIAFAYSVGKDMAERDNALAEK